MIITLVLTCSIYFANMPVSRMRQIFQTYKRELAGVRQVTMNDHDLKEDISSTKLSPSLLLSVSTSLVNLLQDLNAG